MAECPGGRTTRWTRSQFRLGMPGVGQSAGFYHLGDIMDTAQLPPAGVLSSRDLVSPNRGTHTRTVREYEQTITELKKENFDLKLKLYIYDEAKRKNFHKDGHSSFEGEDPGTEVVVKIDSETESLHKKHSCYKDRLLQDALERAEKCETDFKELENKYAELQSELTSLSELPSKEEYLSLVREKEDLIKHIESLKKDLAEKVEEINGANQKIEILAHQNEILEEKIKKKSIALQSFVHKSVQERTMVPGEFKNIVATAIQAAKNKNKDGIAVAVKRFSVTLNEMLNSAQALSEEKENIRSPQTKCLKEEFLEKSSSFLPSQNESFSELSHLQNLKEVFAERNDNLHSLDTSIHESFAKGKILHESAVNVAERDREVELKTVYSEKVDDDAVNELHERLAFSSSIVGTLLEHLKNLAEFMEDLLKNGAESMNISSCLDESLKLTHILSEHLSICEGSKLFEDRESLYSYTDEKSLPYSGVSRDVPESNSLSYPRTHFHEAYIPFVQNYDQHLSKGSDGSQLCWQRWQQLNPSVNYEASHQTETIVVHKNVGYPSSESDIWSEPDRNISMQRIGISLQNSPVSSKSPRKLRLKEKRLSSRLSSNHDTSSCSSQRLSKKRQGSTSRCLFPKENINEDKENYLNQIDELIAKNKSCLQELEDIQKKTLALEDENAILKNNLKVKIGELLASKETIKKLQEEKENLQKKLSNANTNNSKLNNNIEELEEKMKESNTAMDQLTTELQSQKLDLVDMQKKCLEYENKLKQEISKNEECGEKLSKISDLNAEKNCYLEEMESIKEKKLALENENVILNSNLKSKDNELASLGETIKKLQETIETLNSEIADLNAEKNCYLEEMESIKEKKLALENENVILNNNSKSKDNELASLGETIKKLQETIETLNSENAILNDNLISKNAKLVSLEKVIEKQQEEKETCIELQTELMNAKEANRNLQENFDLYKNEILAKCKENEANYSQQLKQLEENSLSEKEKLRNEISVLIKEREDIIQKLKIEKESYEKLIKEKDELNQNYVDSCQQVSSLKLLNEELRNEQLKLTEKNEFFEKALNSSTSECNTLNQDLKHLRETLQNLESKCLRHEKELVAAAGMKDTFVDCLLQINNELSSHRQKIDELNGNENSMLQDEASQSIPIKGDDNIQKLCENLNLESKKLLQSVDLLVAKLKKPEEEKGSNCLELQTELMNAKEANRNLQENFSSYKNELLTKWKECEANYSQQLKQLEEESLSEKEKLRKEISVLKKEKDDIMQKLKVEKQCYEKLMKDKVELNQNYINSCQQMSALKLLNEELRNEQLKLIEKNEFFEKALNSSTSECNTLNQDLKHLQETLQNLEFKCLRYEKELIAATGIKDTLVDCLLQINNELSSHRKKLVELNGNENGMLQDEAFQFIPIRSYDNIQKLCENLNLESKKLLQSVDKLVAKLKEPQEAKVPNCFELETELMNTKEAYRNLQQNFSSYKNEVFTKWKEYERNYCQQLKQLEEKSFREKEKLGNEISVLKKERQDIMQKLKFKNECYEKLMKEKVELNQNYVNTCQQMSALKLLNEELKNEQFKLIEKNEFFEKALNSSTSECNTLNQDLKNLRETLQNLESKCLRYEKELVAAAGMKETLVDCLLQINNELSSHRQKINEVNENENGMSHDETPQFIPVRGDYDIPTLCENLNSESKKLLQSVDMLVAKLKKTHLKSLEEKTSEEKHKSSVRKQTEFYKTEIEHLKSQNVHFQQVVDELKKSLSEKEKSIQFSAFEIQSLKEKLQDIENEIEKKDRLLKGKDDEITMLQERIFNLQTFLNNIQKDESNMIDKTTSIDNAIDSMSLDSQLPSQSTLKVSKMCQTSQTEEPCNLDDTLSCTSKPSCCEKYLKKCYSLQTKLTVRKTRIEMLEKEKNDLKESVLQHLQDKQELSEKTDALNKKLEKLEAELEQKKAFIIELKSELLKTCNSLLDKEKELDDFKEKLSKYEKKFKESREEEEKKIKPSKITMPAEDNSSKFQRKENLDISFPDIFTHHDHKDFCLDKPVSFENFASNVSHYLDCMECFYTSVSKCYWLEDFDAFSKDCTDKAEVKSLLLQIFQEVRLLGKAFSSLFDLNNLLKKFDFIVTQSDPILSSRQDISDKESILSEETIAVSRTESPLSFEEDGTNKFPCPEEKTSKPESGNRLGVMENGAPKVAINGSSCDSLWQRSHYSSPDLGIESDPNHDSSAPEQKEDSKYQRCIEVQKPIVKRKQTSVFTTTESSDKWPGSFGNTLYAISNLPNYELLKKEVKESLIAIKSVLSRTGDGLHHVAKYTSPRKTLEYNTLKSIKFSCENIEACLKTANDLVGKFWTAPCPSESEWKFLNDENQSLNEQLVKLKAMIEGQESEFKKAIGRLEHAREVKSNLEKLISKKLVKTKKVIRQAELKLLETRCQNFPPLPKYPSDQTEQSPQTNQEQQM